MRLNEHHPHNWIAQFLDAKTNDATIELHNQCCNKILHLKSKSCQGTSFGMRNKDVACVFWE